MPYILLKESSMQLYMHFREASKSHKQQTPPSSELNDNKSWLSKLLYWVPIMTDTLKQHWADPHTHTTLG